MRGQCAGTFRDCASFRDWACCVFDNFRLSLIATPFDGSFKVDNVFKLQTATSLITTVNHVMRLSTVFPLKRVRSPNNKLILSHCHVYKTNSRRKFQQKMPSRLALFTLLTNWPEKICVCLEDQHRRRFITLPRQHLAGV